jgi:DeoR/GlpR family transcriptional regulator of sugar metabolism
MRYRSANIRLSAIQSQVDSAGFLSIAQLAQLIGVSEMTIRRDVATLAAGGTLRLTHGGVHSTGGANNQPFQRRQQLNWAAKEEIARKAVELIGLQDSIAIDAGSTTLRLLDRIPAEFKGSIVTHSVPAIATALGRNQYRIIALGGEVLRESAAMVGPLATEAASRLRVRSFFLGAAALDERGVYVAADIERPTKRALMEVADQVVLLADHAKFSQSAPVLLCGLEAIDILVTDLPILGPLQIALKKASVHVL